MRLDFSSGFALGLLLLFLGASVLLLERKPPTGIAVPTSVFHLEATCGLIAFCLLMFAISPIRSLERSLVPARIRRLLNRMIELRGVKLGAVISMAAIGFFFFTFWSLVDILGGYNGDNWSLSQHSYLHLIYRVLGVRYFGPWDVGSQALFFFSVAIVGMTLVLARRGIGTALKDTLTLLVAPTLITFELALWYFAPNDMTWHVIDALWLGGANDLGWRSFDGPTGGAFVFSNWFVLFVSTLILASRIPLLSLPSTELYRLLWKKVPR